MTDPVRVLIVDDDALVRTALTAMLGGSDTVLVVGEATDGEQAVRAVGATGPDVVLMDLAMPVLDGIAATAAIRARAGAPEVVALTALGSDRNILGALRAGAAGFLLKDTPPAQLVDAVGRVARGEPILAPAVARRLIGYVSDHEPYERRDRARAALTVLTDREREIAAGVAEGWGNAEIAARAHLSVPTVKTHITRILAKLDLNNRVQIALLTHDAQL